MRSIAMDVFAMPEVTVEMEKHDCSFLPWTDIAGILWRLRVRSPRRRTQKTSMEPASKPRPSPEPWSGIG